MPEKTLDDLKKLKALRQELIEQRRGAAYSALHAQHHEGVARLAQIHQAIEALDAVIAEGQGAPAIETGPMIG